MSTNLVEDLAYVLRVTDADASRSIDLQDLLVQSAGTINVDTVPTPFYRKYFVCAMEFWLRSENNLKAGEGAVFDQNVETTRRYLTLQQLEEEAQNVTTNTYTIDSLLYRINGNSGLSSILSF